MPAGVHAVKSKGKVYCYWHPGRGTDRAAKRVPLGSPLSPDFWTKLEAHRGIPSEDEFPPGSWLALDRDYRGSQAWATLSEGTRTVYSIRLRLIVATWGRFQVSQTSHDGIIELRETLAKTPVAANQLVSVIGAAMKWGSSRGYGPHAVAKGIEPLDPGEVDGAEPWPEWAYQIVRSEAPEALRRAAFLGRATGQRRSDLVTVGRRERRDDGIEFKIKKLRNKRHFIPLRREVLAEIDSWLSPDIGPYITTAAGKRTTGNGIAAVLKTFCHGHPKLTDAPVFMHGLRALAVCDRRIAGMTHQEISAQIGMSMPMVLRYSKRIDGELLSRAANKRWEQNVTSL